MDNNQKTIWILVGPNGAGKSTFAAKPPSDLQELSSVPYFNQDLILKRNRETCVEMNDFIQRNLCINRSFMVERVMPPIAFIGARFADLQDRGWRIATIAIGLDNAELSKQRVRQRTAHGRHDVKIWDLTDAFSKHVSLLPRLIKLSDFVRVYDNSYCECKLLAEKSGRDRPLHESDIMLKNRAVHNTYLHQIMSTPS